MSNMRPPRSSLLCAWMALLGVSTVLCTNSVHVQIDSHPNPLAEAPLPIDGDEIVSDFPLQNFDSSSFQRQLFSKPSLHAPSPPWVLESATHRQSHLGHPRSSERTIHSNRRVHGQGTLNGCDGVFSSDSSDQVQAIVDTIGDYEGIQQCAKMFMAAFTSNPSLYMDAFFDMISYPLDEVSYWVQRAVINLQYADKRSLEFSFDDAMEIVERSEEALELCFITADEEDATLKRQTCEEWSEYVFTYVDRGDWFACDDGDDLTLDEVMNNLQLGNYACIQSMAPVVASMQPHEDVIGRLVELVDNPNTIARRNSIRVLGLMCWSQSKVDGGAACHQVQNNWHLRDTLTTLIRDEEHPVILDTQLWVLSSVFLRGHVHGAWEGDVADQLKRFCFHKNVTIDTQSQWRACNGFNALLYQHPTIDDGTLLDILAFVNDTSQDPYAQRELSFGVQYLSDLSVLSSLQRQNCRRYLIDAFENNDVLALRVWLAKAIDALNAKEGQSSSYTAALQREVEKEVLPESYDEEGRGMFPSITLRSAISSVTSLFHSMLPETFLEPVQGDDNPSVSLYLFPTMKDYRLYMEAFVGYGQTAGGLYIEGHGVLYTYERTEQESTIPVERLITHEFTHYLHGRFVLQGGWGDQLQPVGWFDEGFAEWYGGVNYSSGGEYNVTLRHNYATRVCERSHKPNLAKLLSRRNGYDDAGVFDYETAYFFAAFLWAEHPDVATRTYELLRSGAYTLDGASHAFGMELNELEALWHVWMSDMCLIFPDTIAGPTFLEGLTLKLWTHTLDPSKCHWLAEDAWRE